MLGEARAGATPMVATDVGGVRAALDEGRRPATRGAPTTRGRSRRSSASPASRRSASGSSGAASRRPAGVRPTLELDEIVRLFELAISSR